MVHPLSIPDIIFHIGERILINDLPSCVRVSKAWHFTLSNFLYRVIELSPNHVSPRCSSPTAIQHQIRYLRFLAEFPNDYLTLTGCNQLTTLRIDITQTYTYLRNSDVPRVPFSLLHGLTQRFDRLTGGMPLRTLQVVSIFIPNLIRNHVSTLTWVTLTCGALPASSSLLWDAMGACPKLVGLDLFSMTIPSVHATSFALVCKRLKSLGVYHCTLPHIDEATLDQITFPDLTEFSWQQVEQISDVHFLRILAKMPQLQSFSWQTGSEPRNDFSGTVPAALRTIAADGFFLQLRSLTAASQGYFSDDDLAHILQHTPNLTCLSVSGTGFGVKAFDALRGQGKLAHMKKLQLAGCLNLPSALVQAILQCCFELEVLEAEVLLTDDIAADVPWVCTNLKRLSVGVLLAECIYSNDSMYVTSEKRLDQTAWVSLKQLHKATRLKGQMLVLDRIATLTRLESLEFTYSTANRDRSMWTTELLVDNGLTKLESLIRLKEFGLPIGVQCMDFPEIDWMIEHWPQLERVSGDLHVNSIVNRELIQRLAEHGIEHQLQ
ncbi:hypothetical protein BG004_002904, partial [Podila humilis]